MNNLLKIIAVFAVAIGILYWVTANPNTARSLKQSIDATVDKLVDSLTD